jgi:mono/diheme cytochrome c family protein
MSPTVRWLLLGIALLAAAAGGVAGSGILKPPPAPIAVTPDLVAAGRIVYRGRCHTCHTDIPLAKRVKGWEPMHAYEVIGRLQTIGVSGKKPMPPFPGTDEDRRALAAWISELGAGRVPQY